MNAELETGKLLRWGESRERAVEIWVLHTSRHLVSSKVQAFVDFLSRRFP